MKKIIAGVLAASLCLAAASCDGPHFESTPNAPIVETTTAAPTDTTAGTETTASAVTTTEMTTEAPTPENPNISISASDLETVQIGKHVTLRYNAASADVTWEVEKGIGSRETVTITATPREGFLFDGWSENTALVNGAAAVTKAKTYSFDATNTKTVFLNTSMQIVYHENGGKIAKSSFKGTDTVSAVYYLNPNTLPAQNYFTRDGYTLTGYNTEADGTGEDVLLGGRVTANGKGKIDLYCVWEKNTDEADFEVKNMGSGVAVTEYKGDAETVVIPATIGGKKVVGISTGAFKNNTSVKRIVVASSVTKIEKNAFENCSALETVVLYDTLTEMDDRNFNGCNNFQTALLNTTNTLIDEWFSCVAGKLDRLIWAKDKKKIVIIGGSGSLFGFDCSIIDEALGGEYEIINFGENANISSVVYFDIVEDFIKEGDIILWCPEPGWYTLGQTSCTTQFWNFKTGNYDFSKYINCRYYDNYFSSFASFNASLSSKKFKDFDVLSASMNKYGDDVSYRVSQNKNYTYRFDYPMRGEFELCDLVESITDKGGKVFYSFAAMQESAVNKANASEILALESLVTSIPGVVSISDYEDLVFADMYFYDSEWHMTDAGAKLRAEQVAKDLLAALGKSE